MNLNNFLFFKSLKPTLLREALTASNGTVIILFLITILIFPALVTAVDDLQIETRTSQSKLIGGARDHPHNFEQVFGWPRQLVGNAANLGQCPSVFDFDGSGDWEISLCTTEGRLFVYQHDGAHFPAFPLLPYQGNRPVQWINPRHDATSAVGDLTGDGIPELVYISDIGYLHVMSEEASEPESFPLDLGTELETGVPALLDLDGDDLPEIIFNAFSTHPDSFDSQAWVHVINDQGEELEGFPVSYPRGSGCSPSVGDIDGVEGLEIVIGNSRYLDSPAQIFAWHVDGSPVEGFPVGGFETINGAATLFDADADGALEILFCAAEIQTNEVGLHLYTGSGESFEGFPLACSSGHPDGSPVACDLTGDGRPEIIFGTNDLDRSSQIYVWQLAGDNPGEIMAGFPLDLNRSIIGSVLIADVSGDEQVDLVAALSPTEDDAGQIMAWDQAGETVAGFPLDLGAYNGGAFSGMPTIWDVDGDWDLDLIAVTTDRRMFVWDTPGRITPDVWLTMKGDMQRTGRRPADDPNRVPEVQPVLTPGDFSVELFPNPFNAVAILKIKISQPTSLSVRITDLTGRTIAELINQQVSTGELQLALDAGKLNLTAGLYFCQVTTPQSQSVRRVLFMP